jgi:hypothetical protein
VRAISIRQPWAALVALGIKDIENRARRTLYRGPLLIHASRTSSELCLTQIERDYCVTITDELTELCGLTGGIIGSVEIVDCVIANDSPWFEGPVNRLGKRNFGFMLRDARILPFRSIAGRLGIFHLPDIGDE